jgi:hypothetical protein
MGKRARGADDADLKRDQKEKARAGAQVASFFLSLLERPGGPVHLNSPSLFVRVWSCAPDPGHLQDLDPGRRSATLSRTRHYASKPPPGRSRPSKADEGKTLPDGPCPDGENPLGRAPAVRRSLQVALRWMGDLEGFRRNQGGATAGSLCRAALGKDGGERWGDGMRHAGSSDLPPGAPVVGTGRADAHLLARAARSRNEDPLDRRLLFAVRGCPSRRDPLVHPEPGRARVVRRQGLVRSPPHGVRPCVRAAAQVTLAPRASATGSLGAAPHGARKGFRT